MRLDEYLSAQAMTQAAFAARIGVSGPTVHRWIAGKARPDWNALGAIERETGGAVTYRDFRGDAGLTSSGVAETQAPLVGEALGLGLDPEEIAAKALRDAIGIEKERRWIEENRPAMDTWNAWTDANELPLANYRAF